MMIPSLNLLVVVFVLGSLVVLDSAASSVSVVDAELPSCDSRANFSSVLGGAAPPPTPSLHPQAVLAHREDAARSSPRLRPMVTLGPSHPISHGQAAAIYDEFPFFGIYESATFSLCFTQLFDQCIPALRRTRAAWRPLWQNASTACRTDFCECLPNGEVIGNMCRYSRPTTHSGQCAVIEKCNPLQDRCVQNFVLQPDNLPGECTEFLRCSALESVRRANYLECLDWRNAAAPGCDYTLACRFISRDSGVDPLASPDDGRWNRIAMIGSIVVGVVAVPLVLCVGVAFVTSVRRRDELAAMEAPLHETERFIDDNVPPGWAPGDPLVAWFPLGITVPRPLRGEALPDRTSTDSGGIAGAATGEDGARGACSYCGSLGTGGALTCRHQRFLQLPCRCRWCGSCEAPVASVAGLPRLGSTSRNGPDVKPSAASAQRMSCTVCSAELQHTLDLEKVYVHFRAGHDDDGDEDGDGRRELMGAAGSNTAPTRVAKAAAVVDVSDGGSVEMAEMATARPAVGAPTPAAAAAATRDGAPSQCTICLDAPASVVFLPCHHVAACAECAKVVVTQVLRRHGRLVAPRCHMCRCSIAAAAVLPPEALLYAAIHSPHDQDQNSVARPRDAEGGSPYVSDGAPTPRREAPLIDPDGL